MKAELIALALASEEANWLRDLLYEIPLWEKPIPPILIHCDSTVAIGRVKNRYYNGKSRPIRRKHSTVRSYLSGGIITVDYCERSRPPARFMMLGQTHMNGWSHVIASQNGGSTDYVSPLRLRVLQWSCYLFNYWKNKKTIIEKFLILLI